jgi:hypothetical protein
MLTILKEKKNSFIENQHKKQEHFRERFHSSMMKMNSKRKRFNETQIEKKLETINLPKNLDKIALQY